MPTMPWSRVNQENFQAPAIAMLTYLPLKHWWDTPMFLSFASQIRAQLLNTPGLIGFSMRAHPFSKNYWTLSLWQDEQSISQYVHTMPHAMIMTNMAGKMGKTAFVSWPVDDLSLPLSWREAMEHKTSSYH